jgi:hypothetical protein
MFEGSRTQVFVCNVTNNNSASYAALAALTGTAGAFYYEPQTFTETAMSTNATLYHRFAFRNTKGVLSMTKPFRYADIKNGGYYAGLARQEQVTYLGYNGTSGSMDATNSTYYGLQVILNHTFGMLNNSPLIVTIPYKSDASATQSEVAAGLAVAGTAAFKRQAYKPLKIERINAGAQANALGTATASLVNGGKQVVFSEDMTALVVAGTILRFGTSGAGTAPCYIVVSHDSGAAAARIYTLDQEYQGDTDATYAAATTESVTEGNWGLKFTGISVTDANFNPVNDEPFVVSFELGAKDFSTATTTYTTDARLGSGTYQLVSALEARCQFENKTREVSAYPATIRNFDAVTGTAGEGIYNIFSFEVWDSNFADATTGINPISKVRYIIAVDHALTEAFHTVLGFGA